MGKATKKRQATRKPDGWLSRWFSKPLRERFCKQCGRPYLGHVEPIPDKRFILGNVEVQMFESRYFGRLRRELKVQCWSRFRDDWYPQMIFTPDDLEHLAVVAVKALRVMKELDGSNRVTNSRNDSQEKREVFSGRAFNGNARNRPGESAQGRQNVNHKPTEVHGKKQPNP